MAEVRKRSEIEEKYKWNLEDIFESESAFEEGVVHLKELASRFEKMHGSIGENSDTLLSALSLFDEIGLLMLSLYAYACMHRDEDNDVSEYRAMADRIGDIESEIMSICAFFEPELIATGKEKIEEFMEENGKLCVYRQYFDNLFREKEHILDEKSERLLAMSSPLGEAAHDIFSAMNNADIRFGEITDENGEKVELTHGRYGVFMESGTRHVRKEAYDAMYKQYKAFKNTFASMYAGSVKSDLFYARARGFASSRAMKLSDSFIPEEIYDSLIRNVEKGLPELSEYLALRKERLSLSELCMYDLYCPIVPSDDEEISYEEACELVLAASAPLGEGYVNDMKRAFSERWVDVYENRGKTSGAYSWGDNTTHPYVLLNYQGKIEDVFTLAHEMGHAMHSYYTNKTQPPVYRDYKIFVAEVASTVNENLLMEYLLKDAVGDRKKYLLGRKLEAIRTTFYRQTMFADFEREAHERYMQGTPLTAETLSELYSEINRKYYGAVCEIDDNISYEWARIPHFYTSFYVYQYATGFAAATKIKELVLSDSANAERYLEFLRGGSSAYPIELLRGAGVDLTSSEPVESVIADMRKACEEIEKIQ